MKKAIIFAVVAFLVSLGGTSAVLVKRGVHAAQVAAQAAPGKSSTVASRRAAFPTGLRQLETRSHRMRPSFRSTDLIET